MAKWNGGFTGAGYDRTGFRAWLRTQKKPPYHRIVNHMTDAPYMKASVPGSQRIKNISVHYKGMGWSGGPDFFSLDGTKVYLGSPLGKSIGCSGWNGNSFHIEVEGRYNGTTHDYRTGQGLRNWEVAAWVQAELLEWMGWEANDTTIKLHKEGNTSHKGCPGVVPKSWIIEQINKARGIVAPAPAPVEAQPDVVYVSGVPEGDWLNFRATPTSKPTGKLYNKTRLEVIDRKTGWLQVRTPGGYLGWVSEAYTSPLKPLPPAPKPEEPIAPSAPVAPLPALQEPIPGEYPPGKAKWSEDWCLPVMKMVEGLRLVAYPDPPGWSIGYGHCSTSNVPPIPYQGMTCTKEEAEDMLRADLNECVRYVNAWVKVPLTQPQVDALCVHIFQQGPTQFRKRVLPTINEGKHQEVAKIIASMAHAKPGVERRRKFEAARYLGSNSKKW